MTGEIFERVCLAIEETAAVGEIGEDSLLKEELGLDSLSLVSVIVGLESMYGIEFDEGDLDPEALTDVKSLVKLVEKSL